MKHGCTLALLTCLDRPARVAYVLGEVFELPAVEAAWICGTTEAAYRKRLSRARAAVREFLSEYCGLVAEKPARCHCRKRVPVAVRLGRVDPTAAEGASNDDVERAVVEMEALYDAASLVRSVPDATAPAEVIERLRTLLGSGGFGLGS